MKWMINYLILMWMCEIVQELQSSRFHSIYSMTSVIQWYIIDVIIIHRLRNESCCWINGDYAWLCLDVWFYSDLQPAMIDIDRCVSSHALGFGAKYWSPLLTTLIVSSSQILCYDSWPILTIAPVRLRLSAFILPRKQFYPIQSTVPVHFLSAVNFEQQSFFPSHCDSDDFWYLNRSLRAVCYFLRPGMRWFIPGIAQDIRKWTEYPLSSCCGVMMLRGMRHEF
jgi:hypothetical protein